jgi:hypothetical protein
MIFSGIFTKRNTGNPVLIRLYVISVSLLIAAMTAGCAANKMHRKMHQVPCPCEKEQRR